MSIQRLNQLLSPYRTFDASSAEELRTAIAEKSTGTPAALQRAWAKRTSGVPWTQDLVLVSVRTAS